MKTQKIIQSFCAAGLSFFLFSCEKENATPEFSDQATSSGQPQTRSLSGGSDLFSKVSFNGEMLEFEDAETFAGVYSYLAQYEPADADEPDPSGVAHLAEFEALFPGYESLRALVEAEMTEMILAQSLSEENNPDDNYIADYVLRTLINQQSKVIIAKEEFEMTREFLGYEEGSDIDRGGCCWMYREKNDYITIPNGTKRIHCKSWVYNIPIPVFWFGVTGSSTRSYWGANGNLQPINVAQISTSSPYIYYLITCSGAEGVPDSYGRSNFNASYIYWAKAKYTFTLPYFISQRTVNHSADYYTGSDINQTLDFCP